MKKKLLTFITAVLLLSQPATCKVIEYYPIDNSEPANILTKDMDYEGVRLSYYDKDSSRFEVYVASMTNRRNIKVAPYVIIDLFDERKNFIASYDTRVKNNDSFTPMIEPNGNQECWLSYLMGSAIGLDVNQMKEIRYFTLVNKSVVPKGRKATINIRSIRGLSNIKKVAGDENIIIDEKGVVAVKKPIRVGQHRITITADNFGTRDIIVTVTEN